jgi:uncharacterized membrane protein YfcA
MTGYALPARRMPEFTLLQWMLVVMAGFGVGLAKAGFSGIGLVPVLIFAAIVGARDSTGVTLPVLIVGDLIAAFTYRQHAQWKYINRMLPAACVGVAASAWAMRFIDETAFRPLLGWITLGLAVLQWVRSRRPEWFGSVPHSLAFAWALGLLAGSTTMLANAAGPVLVLYALAVGLPRFELVGTIGWFFLLINLFKVPFSVGLGLIHGTTILLAVTLAPVVALGILSGRWLVRRIPQQIFETLLLLFALIAALRLILS